MRRMVEPGPRKCCVPTLFPDRGVGNHIDANLCGFIAHTGIARVLERDALDFTAFQDEGAASAPSDGPVSSRSCPRLSTAKLTRDYGIVPRPWREAVDEIVAALVAGPR